METHREVFDALYELRRVEEWDSLKHRHVDALRELHLERRAQRLFQPLSNAIVSVDPSANGIGEIEILNSGTGYTYADVTIIANTGLIDIDTGLATSTSSARN